MNLKSIPLKRWLEFIFTFIIGLLTLLALCFPLQKGGDTVYGIYKYQESGFDLFDFNSICRPDNLEWISTIVGVFLYYPTCSSNLHNGYSNITYFFWEI